MGSSGGSVVKNLPANSGDVEDVGLIPGLGRSPGGGNGNPLQYFCLENPMDREAWWSMFMGSQRVRHNWVTEHEYNKQKYAKRHQIWLAKELI